MNLTNDRDARSLISQTIIATQHNAQRCGFESHPSPFFFFFNFECRELLQKNILKIDIRDGTRTRNLRLRRPTPYPLGHADTLLYRAEGGIEPLSC